MNKEIKGIEEIYFEHNKDSFDQYRIFINGKWINIPVVGNLNPDNEIRMCQVLQSIIDKENEDE